MTVKPDYEVIISGGGPVGTGLAIELGQRGIRVLIIERHPKPQPIPKGQNLTQRTMESFQAWGCERELRAARPIPAEVGMGGITLYRHLLTDYHYDWLNRSSVNAFYSSPNERLPQYETEAVLRARAGQIDCIDIRYGWSVEAVEDQGTQVAVTAASSDKSERQTLTAAYVVGCDGARSVVRETGNIPQKLSDHGRLMVLLVFRSLELHELLKRYPGKAFFNVLHPDQKGYWQFFGRVDVGSWFFHAAVPVGTTADFDFQTMLQEVVGQPFELSIDHIGFWDLRVSIAERYRNKRVFVAGDAAHSHPPYGGFGINTGFEDARNLGWKLAATLQGWGGGDLLDSYDAERRPVFESTARDFIENFIDDDNKFLQTYDPAHDRVAFEAAWYDRNKGAEEVARFEPNYQGSPIVNGAPGSPSARGDHRFEARSGHHLAPQTLSDGTNAFARLSSGFTLLSFGAAQVVVEEFQRVAVALGVPLTCLEDPAPNAYGATLILVRPDHFVAWADSACDDPSAILKQALGL